MERRVKTIIECDGGPVLAGSVELSTSYPRDDEDRSMFSKYALFIAEISVDFEEGNLPTNVHTVSLAKCRRITLLCNMAFYDMCVTE